VVFSSHIFIFYFLPVVLAIYYGMLAFRTSITARHLFLTCAGMVFYGWWNPWFVLLMLGTTALDYNLGRMIVNAEKLRAKGATDADVQRRKKLGVMLSVTSNLAALAFFKYTAFAIESIEGVASWMHWGHVEVPSFFRNIILPAGISFYVFQSLSYCVDLYRGHAKPAESFLDFTCFVSLFPHLVAGPIVRYGIIADQMRHRVHTVEGFALGLTRFSFGLAKKILLADPMGTIADSAFGAGAGSLSTFGAWVGVTAYAFQIYFDFSGYSDMAIGLAKTLGFYFVENFNSPYKSASITEFWRRWHMSLSTFLRDYLYIPLGGNRLGTARTYANLMLTMLIGGLWHGASWTFIIWGGIHGAMLSFERMMGKKSFYAHLPHMTKVIITFLILLVTWVFFRAETFEVAVRYLTVMFGGGVRHATAALMDADILRGYIMSQFAVCVVVTWFLPNTQTILHRFVLWKAVLGLLLFVIAVTLMFARGHSPFLYFQF
jgi:alginate O-acetyltransferase complex protein AlgI